MEIEILEATPNPEELSCKAARNDYGADTINESFEEMMEGVDGETIQEKKETLLSKLIDRGHYGVFEHPTATFAINGVSRACMAQLTRHRHASFDIMSMRYVEVDDPDVRKPPALGSNVPTGRGAEITSDMPEEYVAERRPELFQETVQDAYDAYEELLSLGVAPEHARFLLPIGTRVNIVMTVNVRTLLHIADMRAAGDAQKEIRDMTEALLDEAREWCPFVIDYYEEELQGRKNRLSP